MMRANLKKLCFVSVCSVAIFQGSLIFGQIAVHHTEGLVHGFLVLRTLAGETVAHGDLVQVAHADHVTARLTFHFKDGSVYDDTVIYSQRRTFRLLRDHLVEKGPSFPHPQDISVDVASGQVTVRSGGDDGKEQTKTEYMKLPVNLANGMMFTLLKNIPPDIPETKVSMLVATPKPRLVHLVFSTRGEDTFLLGGAERKASHYVVKIEIGGISGLIAPLLGKEPSDIHVWILRGEAPAFVKSTGPLYFGGPIWQIELESPVWPHRADGE